MEKGRKEGNMGFMMIKKKKKRTLHLLIYRPGYRIGDKLGGVIDGTCGRYIAYM